MMRPMADMTAMPDQAEISTEGDVLATEPVIRRVVAARVANPADVDDLVHDCLERLLAARHRLAPATVLPFSVVTAQNLVFSQAMTAARRTGRPHGTLDLQEGDRPEDRVLAGEARTAMRAALAQLSSRERDDLLAYQELGALAAGGGALRVVRGDAGPDGPDAPQAPPRVPPRLPSCPAAEPDLPECAARHLRW